jgi:hypothetical protein
MITATIRLLINAEYHSLSFPSSYSFIHHDSLRYLSILESEAAKKLNILHVIDGSSPSMSLSPHHLTMQSKQRGPASKSFWGS